MGSVRVIILCFSFSQQAKVVPNNDKDRTYAVSYVPKVAGLHKVAP